VLTIVAPMDNTPGSRAGLLAGDQIVRINGEPTEGVALDQCVGRMKGEVGTSVTLTIHRPSTGETRDVTIVREEILIPSVKDACVLENTTIGYVRVTQFAETTVDSLHDDVRKLAGEHITALILDLRNNPGGLLDSSVEVCSLFLPPGRLVVSTDGRRPSQKQEYLTMGGRRLPDMPMVILINRGSASAAEIVAGCLQDWNRAMLVGETSFGKGSVQNVVPLEDGSALRLTTAMYHTPSRRVIHEHGITPDIEVKLSDEQAKALYESQEGMTPDRRNPDPTRDPQLQRAIDNLRVYLSLRRGEASRFSTPRPAPNPDPADSDEPSGD
jgi:carboxyl-terminal processing protease